ncbi:MAG TPA: NAD+ synthase [Mycobacteriales bacterium]|nr:NAD+ synthase [Mycobacteriales bacterium]
MARLRVGLAQIDVTVGDLAGNADAVVTWAKEAAARGAQLVAFPEMALTGYPPEDLVFRESFRAASAAAPRQLAGQLQAAGLGELVVVVGYLGSDGGPRNAAAVLHRGRLVATYDKHHLPNYGVFDEARYFVPGDRFTIVRVHGVDVAITVCEDLWQDGGPFAVAGRVGVGLVVTINGSPYERNKNDLRLPLAQRRAAEAGAPIAYVNMVGGQDELVYDGDSMVVLADGTVAGRAEQWVETVLVVDLELPDAGQGAGAGTGRGVAGGERVLGMSVERHVVSDPPPRPMVDPVAAPVAARLTDEAEVWGALVTGLRDYARKNSFRTVTLGLSGGIDSAVCATIAADAVGADNVHGVSMPSAYSSTHSRSDAADLADRLGCHHLTVPIAPMVSAYLDTLALAGTPLTGLAEENLQARVRGAVLMGLSNQHGHLVLATGNKTECAVGFTTIYGDAVGGFAPIKDVPKTLVWRLARWRNAEAGRRGETAPVPPGSISKPPSAELRPNQLDSDSLPDYAELDAILADYVDRDLGWAALIERGHDPDTVARVIQLVDRAEYKRRQYPPGTRISLKAFGRDRRLPISHRWRETAPLSR